MHATKTAFFLLKKKKYFEEFNIWERTRKFQFWKRNYIITMEKWKLPFGRKKWRLCKFYGKIIPKELMFQRFTSVSDGYTCFYVIMYSISMDSAYKPFYCKTATDFFPFLLSVPLFYDSQVSGAFWIDFRLFEILE